MPKFFLILILFFIVLLSGQVALAATGYGLEGAATEAGIKQIKLPVLIGKVIGAGLSLIGVVFFALMIYGGFLWMTAHGKEEQAKQGLETVLAAVIGFIIILAAYAITNFAFSNIGGGGGSAPQEKENVGCCVYNFGENCKDVNFIEECGVSVPYEYQKKACNLIGECSQVVCCILSDKQGTVCVDNQDQQECDKSGGKYEPGVASCAKLSPDSKKLCEIITGG